MHDIQQSIKNYGSFHEDLIIGVAQGPKNIVFAVQRRALADKLADQFPIRNATLACKDVQKFEFNEKRVVFESFKFSENSKVDIEIVDIVSTVDSKIRIEIFWEGFIDGKFYRDAKFDIFAGEVDLTFSDIES